MNAPFNLTAAERARADHFKELLGKALLLLSLECDRRQARGEDVSHIRRFIREASE